MNNQMPRTYFTTEFRGGKRAVKARLKNLLSPGKQRRGLVLLVLVALAVSLCAGLVACQPKNKTVEDYAREVVGRDGRIKALAESFSMDGVLDSGTLVVYEMQPGRKVTPTDVEAGGSYIEDGYYFSEAATVLVFREENGTLTKIMDYSENLDYSTVLATANQFQNIDSETYRDVSGKLIARYFLERADSAMAYLTGAAPTDESRTDQSGVTWNRLTDLTKLYDTIRIDAQILADLWHIFPREIGTDLFNRYVYHPGGIFEEVDGALWVRADAAEIIGWDCTADVNTMSIVSGSQERIEFTMEGTNKDQPITWTFVLESDMPDSWQFTQYFSLPSEG